MRANVVTVKSVLSGERDVRQINRRRRINTLAPDTTLPFICLVNGVPVLREKKGWNRCVGDGDVVIFIIRPDGGGGGGSNPLQMVLTIGLAIAAPGIGDALALSMGLGVGATAGTFLGMTASQILGGVIGFVGNFAINALMGGSPKPPSNAQAQTLAAPSPTYSIGAQGNRSRIGQAIPESFGRNKIFPDYAADPYTEFSGDDQFLYQLFSIGMGMYEFESINIEDTPIENFAEVQTQILPPGIPVTLFPTNVESSVEVSGQELQGQLTQVTYSRSGATITIAWTAHGQITGTSLYFDFTSGAGTDGAYPITYIDADHFRITDTVSGSTSGNVTIQQVIGGFIANTAGTLADHIAVDVVCPNGLFYANDDGGLNQLTVNFMAEARSVDDSGNPTGNWQGLNADQTFYYTNYWSKGYWSGNNNDPLVGGTTGAFAQFQQPAARWVQTGYGSTVAGDHTDGQRTGVVVQVGSSGGIINQPLYSQEVWRWIPFGADPHPPQNYTASVPALSISAATNTPIRNSYKFSVAPGRYEVRMRRTDLKNQSSRAGHSVVWAGLRSYIPGADVYPCTTLAVKIRATNNISGQASQRVNCIVTRMLPIWNGTEWQPETSTRSIAWALAYICRQRMSDDKYDLAWLMDKDATWAARGDTFNYIFDGQITFGEALTSVARAGRAKWYQNGSVIRFFRDEPATMPVAMFTPRNIVKGSYQAEYVMTGDQTADAVIIQYIDETTWMADEVLCQLPGSTIDNPVKIQLTGVTNRDQAFKEGMYAAAANRYRRMISTITTEMEGFIPLPGDMVALSRDKQGYGQSGEVLDYDDATRTITTSDPLEFTPGQNHYFSFRLRDGSPNQPWLATAGEDEFHAVLHSDLDFTPDTDLSRERTHYSFGPGQTYQTLHRLISPSPRSMNTVELKMVNEDDAVHTAELSATPAPSNRWNLPSVIHRPVIEDLLINVGGTMQVPLLVASWKPAAWADHYVVQLSLDAGATWVSIGNPINNQISFAPPANALQLRIAGVGVAQGEWLVWSGDFSTLPLADISSAITFYRNGYTWMSWSEVTDPARKVEYELRRGATWESADIIGTTPLLEAIAGVNGNWLIKAKSGQAYSRNAFDLNISNAILTNNVIAEWNEADTGWSGTLTNGLAEVGSEIWMVGSGDVLTAPDFLAIPDLFFYGGIGTDGTYTIPSAHEVNLSKPAPCLVSLNITARGQKWNEDFLGTADVLSLQDVLGAGNSAFISIQPQIALAQDDGIYGAWQDYTPGIYNARHFKARVIINSSNPQVIAVVSAFTFAVDVPDRVDNFSMTTLAGGSTVTYDAPFNGGPEGFIVPLVQITIVNASDGDDAVLTSQTLNGFNIQIKNGGVGVARTINALSQGY